MAALNGAGSPGVTLIELIVVLSIISILALALGISFQGWIGRYKVESQIRQMHSDLMNARARAMMNGTAYFVTGGTKTYSIYADTNPPPDGDGVLDGLDKLFLSKDTAYALLTNGESVSGITFQKTGLISNSLSVRLVSDAESPDYDCIDIRTTRLTLGVWNGTACAPK